MKWLARFRVFLGFVFAAIALWLATPTRESLFTGAGIMIAGECVRIWAAGHLEKSKEVTRSGPYRFTRHPLYLGSSLLGVGFAIAASHRVVTMIVVAYLLLTLTAAMRSEEAHLREKFGDEYDAYAEKRAAPMQRSFSWHRAMSNREYQAMAGVVAALLILAMKV
ncbi:MAG TPA: isoprenylcysteine carboxylmethyltransferase family protein [Vicinamibacterales bacterium]|nr:isoprenylcysteine carboxylmethyltransferase family protein [Vicinamibacterales bacterium]